MYFVQLRIAPQNPKTPCVLISILKRWWKEKTSQHDTPWKKALGKISSKVMSSLKRKSKHRPD